MLYPKDMHMDELYQIMTWEERGIYRHLLDVQWIEGSIPGDIPTLSKLLKIPEERMGKIWETISQKFTLKSRGRLMNKRLCQERSARKHNALMKKERAKCGAKARWHKEKDATSIKQAMLENALSSSSSSSSSLEEKNKKKNKSPSPPPTAAALLCDILRNCILEKDPSTKVPMNAWNSKVGWGKEARLLLETDGRPAEEAEKLIRWATSDTFWQGNILSMTKFRQQYDRLKRQCMDIPKKTAIDRMLEEMENE
jgi:uncharacterized protein YdaU (DUF1376 family)